MKVIGTDRGIAYITELSDWFASLKGLNNECKNYTDSELRYREIIKEYNEQIRADAIKEVISYLHEYEMIDCNCCTENNRCDRDCWDVIAEQLKEQK